MSDSLKGANIKLHYFTVRGRAELIRISLAIAGVPFDDIRITFEEWKPKKEAGLSPFKILPVLDIDGNQMTDVMAICQYIAQTTDLGGATAWDSGLALSIAGYVNDALVKMYNFYFEEDKNKSAELEKEFYTNYLPMFFENCEKFLVKNKATGSKFFVGKKVSLADVYFFYYCDILSHGKVEVPERVRNFKNLVEHYNMMLTIPELKSWLDTRPVTEM